MPAKGATGKADTLFSKLVRERDGYRCWAIGYVAPLGNHPKECYPYNIQCAHIIRREYRALRWQFENALTMCAAHHMWFTGHDRHFEEYVRYRGIDFDALHWRSLHDPPERAEEALARLKEISKKGLTAP